MDIIIRNSGGIPIYDQITRQVKGLILRGELREGEALPSMRLLAKELRISVITAKTGGVTLGEMTETLNLLYGDES